MHSACAGFPRLYAAASLKPDPSGLVPRPGAEFSAALCRGLIEAPHGQEGLALPAGFPRLYAAASLKRCPW